MTNEVYGIDRVFRDYFRDVGKYPILSAHIERQYLKRYKTCPHCTKRIPDRVKVTNCPACGIITRKSRRGDRNCQCPDCNTRYDLTTIPKYCTHCGSDKDLEARDKLIVSNLRFVVTLAKKLSKSHEHIQKLISAGNLGLMTAVDKFDLSRNTRFLTYAAWWIRKEMMDEINNNVSIVRIPSHKQKAHRKEMRQGVFVCRHCGLKTIATSCEEHEAHEYVPCTENVHHFEMDTSTAKPLGSAVSIDQVEITDNIPSVENTTINDDSAALLRDMLLKMPLRQRDLFIVLQYYNVPSDDRKTENKSLHQIAALTDITPERVRQIKESVLKNLRRELQKQSITGITDVVY